MYELIAWQYCINKFDLPVDHAFRLSSEGVERKPAIGADQHQYSGCVFFFGFPQRCSE